MSARSKARKRALDVLFEAELRGADPLAILADRIAEAEPPVRPYTATLVEGVVAHADEIDKRIIPALAPGWSLPRLPRVDRQALRIAVLEMDHLDVPEPIAVSEAVALVSSLSTDESPAFVNGVLGGVLGGRPVAS